MKRIDQLQALSKEHHLSLCLAKKCKDARVKLSEASIKDLAEQLKIDFAGPWQQHFDIEEKTIFIHAQSKGEEFSEICRQLKNEHRLLKQMVAKIYAGEYQMLADFGQLLHDHTRTEERRLFPMVESLFNQQELDNILQQH